MSHKHTRGPKRGQCGNCPATKGLAMVEVAPGRKLALCLECRRVLRRLQNKQSKAAVASALGGRSGIVPADVVDDCSEQLAIDTDAVFEGETLP